MTESEPKSQRHLMPSTIRDRAALSLVIGVILLMPPVVGIFHVDAKVAGLPFTLVYLFAVWAVLILAARWLARRLTDNTGTSETDPSGGD